MSIHWNYEQRKKTGRRGPSDRLCEFDGGCDAILHTTDSSSRYCPDHDEIVRTRARLKAERPRTTEDIIAEIRALNKKRNSNGGRENK